MATKQATLNFAKAAPPAAKRRLSASSASNEPVASSSSTDVGGTSTTSSKKARTEPFDKDTFVASLSKDSKEGQPSEADLLDLECSTIGATWLPGLSKELKKPYFKSLKQFLRREGVEYSSALEKQKKSNKVFPQAQDVYSWSRHTRLDQLKVVILGQDPYHNIDQAHGLAFSVQPGIKTPPSLVNIFKEVKANYPEFDIPKHGYLGSWASQGVLCLNTCLTVRAHNANSHAKQGWEEFTDAVLKLVNKHGGEGLSENKDKGVVFMAWGKPAEKRTAGIDKSKHLILTSPHPSPLSAARGFHGCRHFIKANEWLEKQHGEEAKVDWTKLDLPEETAATN